MPHRFKVQIRQSGIEGNGVFALEDIPKGSIYWSFLGEDGTTPNKAHSRQDFESMGEQEVKAILHGGFYFAIGDRFIQCSDGSQFTNHSTNPNTRLYPPSSASLEELKAYAIRDIKAGEEISEWYPDFFSGESEWLTALLDKYEPHRKEFEWKIKNQSGNLPHEL